MFHCVDKHTTAALAQCNFDVICVQWGPGASRVSCRGPKLHINVAGIGHCEEREGGGGDEEQLCRHVASSGVAARSQLFAKQERRYYQLRPNFSGGLMAKQDCHPGFPEKWFSEPPWIPEDWRAEPLKTRERVLKFQASAKSRNQTSNHGEHCHRHTIVAECNI